MRSILNIARLLIVIVILSSASKAVPSSDPPALLNRISGQVFDQSHNPVPDIDVELLNEVDSILARTRTNGSGSFSFLGVSSGHFQVRVVPLRTGLIGETKDVEVTPLYAGGSDSVYVDFYLRYDKRTAPPIPKGPGEAVFVQDVPEPAKKLFDNGLDKLERGQIVGLDDVKAAIAAFPEYFDALSLLGREYIKQEKFSEGYPYLLRALDVNQRSASVYYSLAFAFYKLDQLPAAVKAIDACLVLNGASADAHLLRGTILRQSKSYKAAEAALQKAQSLYKNSNAEVHWQLALLYNRTNRNAEAIDHLQQFLKLSPDSPDRKKVEELIAKLKASSDGAVMPKN
jgi:hypothetical protein